MTFSKTLTLSIFIALNLFAHTNSTAQDIKAEISKKDQVQSSLAPYAKYIGANKDAHLRLR